MFSIFETHVYRIFNFSVFVKFEDHKKDRTLRRLILNKGIQSIHRKTKSFKLLVLNALNACTVYLY